MIKLLLKQFLKTMGIRKLLILVLEIVDSDVQKFVDKTESEIDNKVYKLFKEFVKTNCVGGVCEVIK